MTDPHFRMPILMTLDSYIDPATMKDGSLLTNLCTECMNELMLLNPVPFQMHGHPIFGDIMDGLPLCGNSLHSDSKYALTSVRIFPAFKEAFALT